MKNYKPTVGDKLFFTYSRKVWHRDSGGTHTIETELADMVVLSVRRKFFTVQTTHKKLDLEIQHPHYPRKGSYYIELVGTSHSSPTLYRTAKEALQAEADRAARETLRKLSRHLFMEHLFIERMPVELVHRLNADIQAEQERQGS